MHNKKKIHILGCLFLIVLVCSLSAVAVVKATNNEIQIYLDGNFTQDEAVSFIDKLQQKELSKLIDEANELDLLASQEDEVIYYYDVIRSKLSDVSVDDITAELLSEKNTDDVKINLLILCSSEGVALNYEELLPMLDDDSISASVKGVLLDLIAGEGSTYADEIEARAYSCSDSDIMEVLTTLQSLRPEKAEMIANEILSDITSNFSEKHKAALVTKANSLHSDFSQQEAKDFIDICNDMLNKMPADDEEEKEISVIYALSSMQSKDSFYYLFSLESENAISFRAYIVEENQSVINDILSEKPSADAVILLAKIAPYYVPKKEYFEKINIYLTENAEYFDEKTEQKNILLEVIT